MQLFTDVNKVFLIITFVASQISIEDFKITEKAGSTHSSSNPTKRKVCGKFLFLYVARVMLPGLKFKTCKFGMYQQVELLILVSNTMEVEQSSEQNVVLAVPEKKAKSNDHGIETRKIQVPKHRMVPLKENWLKIFNPVVEHLKLQIRFNLKTKKVEIRTSKDTQDISNLQKGNKCIFSSPRVQRTLFTLRPQ